MKVRSMNARFCKMTGCGRPMRARGYCQSHYKHLVKTGHPSPLQPRRPPRSGSVRMSGSGLRLSGLALTREVTTWIALEAKRRSVTKNAVITDLIEAWAKRRR